LLGNPCSAWGCRVSPNFAPSNSMALEAAVRGRVSRWGGGGAPLGARRSTLEPTLKLRRLGNVSSTTRTMVSSSGTQYRSIARPGDSGPRPLRHRHPPGAHASLPGGGGGQPQPPLRSPPPQPFQSQQFPQNGRTAFDGSYGIALLRKTAERHGPYPLPSGRELPVRVALAEDAELDAVEAVELVNHPLHLLGEEGGRWGGGGREVRRGGGPPPEGGGGLRPH